MQITIADYQEANNDERLDAQFFRPDYVSNYKKIIRKKYDCLSNIAYISDGNHLKIAEQFDESKGVRYLRGQDLAPNMMLTDRNIVYIPETVYDTLKRSHILKYDILITIVGANTGLVGLVFSPPEKLVANCKLGIVRMSQERIFQGYLYAFLISKLGQYQILRSIRRGGQTGLILPDMRSLRVSRLNSEIEEYIHNIVLLGHEKIIDSKKTYNQAQKLLLSELGLSNWQPKHHLSFIKNYSDTEQAGRIDAEYYQPKYDEIAKSIKNYQGGWDTLENLVTIRKCVEVGSKEYIDDGIPFIRVSNLSPFEITEEKYISEKLYSELKQHQPKQGEILFSKDATPGIAYHLKDKPVKFVPSGGILRLKLKDNRLNEDYLTLVLNSIIIKEQVNRDVGGSVILHWRPDQVKQALIPILNKEKQQKIQQQITKSFNLRQQSKHLLECAKRAVEIAIEQNETKALKWLKEQTKDME